MQNVQFILNEDGFAFEVKCEIDLENLEGCELFETEEELCQAHREIHKNSGFRAELITIDEAEIVSNFDGVIGVVDSCVAVYVSAFSY